MDGYQTIMELYYVRMMMDNILIWCWVLADCYVIGDICLGICGDVFLECYFGNDQYEVLFGMLMLLYLRYQKFYDGLCGMVRVY